MTWDEGRGGSACTLPESYCRRMGARGKPVVWAPSHARRARDENARRPIVWAPSARARISARRARQAIPPPPPPPPLPLLIPSRGSSIRKPTTRPQPQSVEQGHVLGSTVRLQRPAAVVVAEAELADWPEHTRCLLVRQMRDHRLVAHARSRAGAAVIAAVRVVAALPRGSQSLKRAIVWAQHHHAPSSCRSSRARRRRAYQSLCARTARPSQTPRADSAATTSESNQITLSNSSNRHAAGAVHSAWGSRTSYSATVGGRPRVA